MTKVIAVDAMNMLYAVGKEAWAEAILCGRNPGKAVQSTMDQLVRWYAERAPVALILDGNPPKAKTEVIQKRLVHREDQQNHLNKKLAKLGADETSIAEAVKDVSSDERDVLKQAIMATVRFKRQHALNILRSVCNGRIRLEQAPGEAEAQAAYWQRIGHAEVIVSADMDAFRFGATTVRMDFWSPHITSIRGVLARKECRTRKQFVEISVLAGRTAYAPQFDGCRSLMRANLALKEAGGFDALVGATESTWHEARKLFLEPAVSAPLVDKRRISTLQQGQKISIGTFA